MSLVIGKRSGNTPSEVQRNNGVRLFLSGRDLLDIDIAATRIHLWKKFKERLLMSSLPLPTYWR